VAENEEERTRTMHQVYAEILTWKRKKRDKEAKAAFEQRMARFKDLPADHEWTEEEIAAWEKALRE